MIRLLLRLFILLHVSNGFAIEVGTAEFPCSVVGTPGELRYGNVNSSSGVLECFGGYNNTELKGKFVDTQLAARRLQELQNLNAKMDAMTQTNSALKGAIDNLTTAIQQLNTSNTAWKQHTLDATVKTIEATPQRIADNNSVIKVLALKIADSLKTNQEFLKSLPDSIAADSVVLIAIADKAAEKLAQDPQFLAKIKSAKP